MEKVKYNIAIQTFMEVFDYLITNDLFVFDSGKDFLQSRIRIGQYGFVEETQVSRGVWDDKHPNIKLIPAIRVLKVLTDNIDKLLNIADVPVSPSSNYAYLHDLKSKMSNEKSYFSSYEELLRIFKEIYNAQLMMESSDGKVIDIAFARYQKFSKLFSKMTPLEKRTIECYAKLEQELIDCTLNLLAVDEFGYPLDVLHRYILNESNDVNLAERDTYVYWEDFKDSILNHYEYEKEEKANSLHGIYSSWERNPYKSELGLDGLTK